MTPRVIAGFVLIALSAIFILQNTGVVDLRFLFWTVSMSRVLLILILLAIGFALGWIVATTMRRRRFER
jgi:lipopolysaccharide assembly protein A